MYRTIKAAAALLLAVCLMCAAAAAIGESIHSEVENPDFEMEVLVGYDGMMTYGRPMPVTVRIRNFGADFEGTLGVNAHVDDKQYDRYEVPVSIPASSQREYTLAIKVFGRQDVYTAELVRDGEKVCAVNAQADTLVNPSAMLVGVLSTRAQNLNNLCITMENDVLSRYELWQTIPLTAENFPEDLSLLKSFGILVLDDLDPASLTQKQQDTLRAWLQYGRILLCGGGATAARNVPFFSELTGLQVTKMSSSGRIISALEQSIGRNVSGRVVPAATAVYEGAEPLVRDEEGNGLIWRTQTGAGRIYTAAFETGDIGLNADPLMHYYWQQLLVDRDQPVYNTALYQDSDSYPNAVVNVSYAVGVQAKSHLLPGMLIIAGAILIACLAWWILKRMDRRQLMWLVLPLVAVIATAGILLLSFASQTNRPLAVLAENLIQDNTGSIRDYCGVSVATPSFGRHYYTMPSENLRVRVYDYVDWDEEEEKKQAEPDKLRTCNITGGENAVTADSLSPWDQISLSSESAAQVQGKVEGSVWMEEDGLHGEIVNGTDLSLAEGWVITTMGYVKVPALAPGDKADILLVMKTQADPMNPVYENGCMYQDSAGTYQILNAAMGYTDEKGYPDQEHNTYNALINGAIDQIRQEQGSYSYGAFESTLFLYCACPVNLPHPQLSVDGETVEGMTSVAMLTTVMNYETVGKTGVVFRTTGMDIPERVEIDDAMKPTDEVIQSFRSYYYSLMETPTFRFELKDLNGMKVESLLVVLNSWYANVCKAYAYNTGTGDWDEIELNKNLKDPGKYLDENGRLYLQFRATTQDIYEEIPTPMINLQGRVEHAEN